MGTICQGEHKISPKYKLPLFTLILALSLVIACASSDIVRVVQVIDGDTIIIQGGEHVRYIGIDTPEKNEPLYLEATRANQSLVEGKRVRLERDISNRDKYGRLLRYVYVNELFVNAELVGQGYAYAKAYPPDIKYQIYLEAREMEAKKMGRGIWKREKKE